MLRGPVTLVHIIIGLSRRWNTYTAEVVEKPFGGVLAAILYCLGSLVLALSVLGSSLVAKLTFYVVGSLIMGRGTSLIWGITSQVVKDHGKRQIEKFIWGITSVPDEGSSLVPAPAPKVELDVDVDAKISQLQVLFRFAASAVGPLLASKLLLPLLAPSQAYLGLAGIVLGLCVFLIILVTMIQPDSSQAEDPFVFIVSETIKTLSDNNASILPPIDQIKVEVGW
jgi:hypothetical protein